MKTFCSNIWNSYHTTQLYRNYSISMPVVAAPKRVYINKVNLPVESEKNTRILSTSMWNSIVGDKGLKHFATMNNFVDQNLKGWPIFISENITLTCTLTQPVCLSVILLGSSSICSSMHKYTFTFVLFLFINFENRAH